MLHLYRFGNLKSEFVRMAKKQPYLVQGGVSVPFGRFEHNAALSQLGNASSPDLLGRTLDQLAQLRQPREVQAITELLILYGLRISDALGIEPRDIMRDGSIRVVQSKGSAPLFCHSVNFRQFWAEFAQISGFQGFVYNRFYFYRLFKKIGLYGLFGSNNNNAVTHYPRHIRALSVSRDGADLTNITHALGHNSTRSASYYAAKKKQ